MIVAERQRRLAEKHLQKSIARLLKALEKEFSALDFSDDDAARGSPAWPRKWFRESRRRKGRWRCEKARREGGLRYARSLFKARILARPVAQLEKTNATGQRSPPNRPAPLVA
jgi:hypothetical protein